MNPLKTWIVESREQQRLAPERYLAHYPEIEFVGACHVRMTRELRDIIRHRCGQYDMSFPTGHYCGKMFLRGNYLCWFGISRQQPMESTQLNYREIILVDG